MKHRQALIVNTLHTLQNTQKNGTNGNKSKHFSLTPETEEISQDCSGYNVKHVLREYGFSSITKLTSTLQGIIEQIYYIIQSKTSLADWRGVIIQYISKTLPLCI